LPENLGKWYLNFGRGVVVGFKFKGEDTCHRVVLELFKLKQPILSNNFHWISCGLEWIEMVVHASNQLRG
jgi:hypothetical protein